MTEPADPLHFEDIQVGQVIPMGACAVDGEALTAFIEQFAPHRPAAEGAPEAVTRNPDVLACYLGEEAL